MVSLVLTEAIAMPFIVFTEARAMVSTVLTETTIYTITKKTFSTSNAFSFKPTTNLKNHHFGDEGRGHGGYEP